MIDESPTLKPIRQIIRWLNGLETLALEQGRNPYAATALPITEAAIRAIRSGLVGLLAKSYDVIQVADSPAQEHFDALRMLLRNSFSESKPK